jgi:hypothetical protein
VAQACPVESYEDGNGTSEGMWDILKAERLTLHKDSVVWLSLFARFLIMVTMKCYGTSEVKSTLCCYKLFLSTARTVLG